MVRRVPHRREHSGNWRGPGVGSGGAMGVTVLKQGCNKIVKDSFGSKFQKPTSGTPG